MTPGGLAVVQVPEDDLAIGPDGQQPAVAAERQGRHRRQRPDPQRDCKGRPFGAFERPGGELDSDGKHDVERADPSRTRRGLSGAFGAWPCSRTVPRGAPASIQRRTSSCCGPGSGLSSSGIRRSSSWSASRRTSSLSADCPGTTTLSRCGPRQDGFERIERQAARDVEIVAFRRAVADRATPGEERPDVALVGRGCGSSARTARPARLRRSPARRSSSSNRGG